MSTENLRQEEAITKLKELVNKIDIGILCTYPQPDAYVHAVPMSRQEIDDEGNIWYLFSSESDTYKNLQRSNRVSILFSHVGDYNFLSLDTCVQNKFWCIKMAFCWYQEQPFVLRKKKDPLILV